MKKLTLLFLVASLLVSSLVSCGGKKESSSSPKQEYESSETNTVPMDLEGYCLKAKDGILLITGEGADQKVYIITKDESENKITKQIEDGDHINLHGEVLSDYFPANITLSEGNILDKNDKVQIDQKLYDTLKTFSFIDESNDKIEIK